MATGAQVWSTTAGSNNSIDSAVNWAEGQAPSSVNDSARGMMASVASFRDDNSGVLATTGSSVALHRYQQAGLHRSCGRLYHRGPVPCHE